MTALLTTKLHQPALPTKRVERPQLIHRLNAGLESGHQVFLVSAPAGFGKTTCVSEWVNTLARWPVTWLSLDSADDDPGRFFTYLLAALQKVDEDLGREIEGILRAGQLPPAEIVATSLTNDISDLNERFIMVLDDFQVIQDAFILQVLGTLVDSLPESLHLVLLTREDPLLPLARLRARNQLTEIRAGDLRFSRPEIDHFLQDVMGLSLSRPDVSILEERTEGWAAGLHLAGLSIRDRSDPSAFIANLSGSQRFILNYLTEEVLSRQPGDVIQFLLQTSVLDRLNADLCNAVTGRKNSGSLLEQLFTDNLFILPLDDEGHWYRYHHLFVGLLRETQNKNKKDETVELHRRASQWYGRAGMVNEAIQHALAAEDYETAVRMIENHAMDLLMQWHVKTVKGWMQTIPLEWIGQSPRANLVFAWLYLMRGDPDPAFPYLERLGSLFSDSRILDDPALKARWLALQSMLLNAQGKAAESLALSQQALDIVPKNDVLTLSQIYLGMATSYQQLDDYPHAVDAFQMIARHSRQAGNSVSEMLGIAGMALFAIQRGELHFAFEIVSNGIERMEHSGVVPPVSTALYGELGVIHYQWHQLDRAHENFQRAIKVSTLSGYSDAELYYGVILSRLFQIAGDLDSAASEIEKSVKLMQVEAASVVDEEIVAQQVRVYLAQDRLAAAEVTLKGHGFVFGESFSFPALEENLTRPMGLLYISALRILLYRASTRDEMENLKQGLEIATRLIEGALQRHYSLLVPEMILLRARIQAALGNEAGGLADIRLAVELAEPEGFISIFVEEGPLIAEALKRLLRQGSLDNVQAGHARNILAAFSRTDLLDSSTGASLSKEQASKIVDKNEVPVESFSDRELEVLRLMAEGLKYEEIAARLFISLNTVRSHVKALYGKFNVNNRTRAIAIAKELKLI
jgi:LuxR family maltose regulon positive regulatory protein